jgi:drug/metabolite transporter (DMT)-like permease
VILHERIDGFMIAGTAIIVPAVALVTLAEAATASDERPGARSA